MSAHLHETALALLLLKVPSNWSNTVGIESSPPPEKWDLKEWCADLVMRFAFMDKIVTWGLERTPTFWLGAFFNPQSLLSIFHQVLQHSILYIYIYIYKNYLLLFYL